MHRTLRFIVRRMLLAAIMGTVATGGLAQDGATEAPKAESHRE